MKKRKTSNNRSRVFKKAFDGGREGMERWRELKLCFGELRLFKAFVMLKATFSDYSYK